MADLTEIVNIKDINPYIENSLKYLKICNKNPFDNIAWKYVSTQEVKKIINPLKNSNATSYDEITTRLLKLSTPYIISPLTYICNLALNTGVFPERLKYAIVNPIHRSDTCSMSNYRQISIPTAFSKILEKIIYIRLINHIDTNNILTPYLFGFRKHFSTDQAIFSLINNILEAMNKHQIAAGMFCDLHKAFDSVNHQILLKKIQFYGIRGKMQ
jgi:hypothetical protein